MKSLKVIISILLQAIGGFLLFVGFTLFGVVTSANGIRSGIALLFFFALVAFIFWGVGVSLWNRKRWLIFLGSFLLLTGIVSVVWSTSATSLSDSMWRKGTFKPGDVDALRPAGEAALYFGALATVAGGLVTFIGWRQKVRARPNAPINDEVQLTQIKSEHTSSRITIPTFLAITAGLSAFTGVSLSLFTPIAAILYFAPGTQAQINGESVTANEFMARTWPLLFLFFMLGVMLLTFAICAFRAHRWSRRLMVFFWGLALLGYAVISQPGSLSDVGFWITELILFVMALMALLYLYTSSSVQKYFSQPPIIPSSQFHNAIGAP